MEVSVEDSVDIPKDAFLKFKCKWCDQIVHPQFMFMMTCGHIYHYFCAFKAENYVLEKCKTCRNFSNIDQLRLSETKNWIEKKLAT